MTLGVAGTISVAFLVVLVALIPGTLQAAEAAGPPAPLSNITVRTDVGLREVPPLVPSGAIISLVGRCRGRRCIIEGYGRFPLFRSNTGGCSITFENLEIRNVVGGVFRGGCSVYIRNCLFRNCTVAGLNQTGGALQLSSQAETLAIINSVFVNNRAPGDGGAISVGSNGQRSPAVFISRTSFNGNRAGGSGGALAVWGNKLHLRDVNFTANTAQGSGGALRLGGQGLLRAINLRFEGNTAATGSGGAVELRPVAGPTDYVFCRLSVRGNRAPRNNKTNSISIPASTSLARNANIQFCGGLPPGSASSVKTPGPANTALQVGTSCVGCSGCTSDCYRRGRCLSDSFGLPVCACEGNWDPLNNCASCLQGYTGANCTSCVTGFAKNLEGKCQLCRGVAQVASTGTYVSASITPTPLTCQVQCRNAGPLCDLWVWGASGSACPRVCTLFEDNRICGKGNVTLEGGNRLFFQRFQQVRGACSAGPR